MCACVCVFNFWHFLSCSVSQKCRNILLWMNVSSEACSAHAVAVLWLIKSKPHRLPPLLSSVAVRMLSVVAGYGGGVCLSMRWGKPVILAVCESDSSEAPPWLECLTLIWTSRRKMSPTMRTRRYLNGGRRGSLRELSQQKLCKHGELAASLVGCQRPPRAYSCSSQALSNRDGEANASSPPLTRQRSWQSCHSRCLCFPRNNISGLKSMRCRRCHV